MNTTTPASTDHAVPDISNSGDDATLSVLVADKFEQSGLDGLKRLGCRVAFEPALGGDALKDAIIRIDPDVMIVRSTKVPADALQAAKSLSLIVRAGAGYDNIDVETASARGVFVANCPGKNALAVAELVWALILCCDRRVPDQTIALREGKWNKKEFAKAQGLFGRTLGIIGLGRIGEAVAERAEAFGMKTIAWSRSLTRERAEALGIGFCDSPLEVAQRADIVSIHVASTPDTKHLVNSEFLNAMKNGAYLINTSRGPVVDEAALSKAVKEKGIRAGLDVYENQPAPEDQAFSNAIVHESGVYGTHHCGASTNQAQEAIAAETVRIVQVYQQSGQVPNCVNRAASSPATWLLTVRHLNKPGVLAHVFHVLSDGGINVEEMENIIYDGLKAACARIQLDDRPNGGQLDMIGRNANILSVDLNAMHH